MFLLIPHQVFAALQMIYRQEQWKGGGCSDPGSTAEVVSSMSSWWGINVIWHNGRIRKKLCLHLTLWQAHDGVWPRGRGPEWEEPKARSGDRVRPGLQGSPNGRVSLTHEVDSCLPSPFVHCKPGLINISQCYFFTLLRPLIQNTFPKKQKTETGIPSKIIASWNIFETCKKILKCTPVLKCIRPTNSNRSFLRGPFYANLYLDWTLTCDLLV